MKTIKDYFHRELEIGDLVLLSNPRKHGDCSYKTMIVTATTESMIRCVSFNDFGDIKCDLTNYYNRFSGTPRRHGALIQPWNVVKLKSQELTKAEVEDCWEIREEVNPCASIPLSTWPVTMAALNAFTPVPKTITATKPIHGTQALFTSAASGVHPVLNPRNSIFNGNT